MSTSVAIQFDVTKYGEERPGSISWNIRRVGKELFSDPMFIVKEGLNNSVDEGANVIEIEHDGHFLLVRDNGERGLKISDFVHYGESRKYGMGVTGRYGHGFKDAALSSGDCIYAMTNRGGRVEQYRIFEDKKTEEILYQRIETNRQLNQGTEFIIALRPDTKFIYKARAKEFEGAEGIRGALQEYARLGVHFKTFQISVNSVLVESGLSSGKEVDVDCGEGMKARGIYIETPGEIGAGIHIYARGLYLDSMPFHLKGALLLDMPFLLTIPRMITPKKEIWWGHRKWRNTIEPAIKYWVKEYKLEPEDGDVDFLKTISRFLKFVLRESKPLDAEKEKRTYIRSGRYWGRNPAETKPRRSNT